MTRGFRRLMGLLQSRRRRRLLLERKIKELAVQHNQGKPVEQLTAPKLDPDMKVIRVSTRMEVKIASWLVNSKSWGFEVAVRGHVTEKEFMGLLDEARWGGLTLYYMGAPHN